MTKRENEQLDKLGDAIRKLLNESMESFDSAGGCHATTATVERIAAEFNKLIALIK